ncbi:hypothetical protein [Ferrovibrio sp.]|uniref:hypothetical protein n=1 Tax=Ferrovibrio sp. TaxID=1917215 RepID=UPI0035B30463
MIALYRLVTRLAAALAGLAALCALLAGVILCADLVLQTFGADEAPPGWGRLYMLLILIAACMAVPHGFMAGTHTCVQGMAARFSWHGQQALKLLAALLGLVLMLAVLGIGWLAVRKAGLPLTIALPPLLGAGGAALACMLLLWRHLWALRKGTDALETEGN